MFSWWKKKGSNGNQAGSSRSRVVSNGPGTGELRPREEFNCEISAFLIHRNSIQISRFYSSQHKKEELACYCKIHYPGAPSKVLFNDKRGTDSRTILHLNTPEVCTAVLVA